MEVKPWKAVKLNIKCVLIYVQTQDAHSIVPDFDQDSSLFGVYDGHGGKSCRHCSVLVIYLSLTFKPPVYKIGTPVPFLDFSV